MGLSPPGWFDFTLEDVYPGGCAFKRPVHAGLNLFQQVKPSELLRTAVDLVPDAGTFRINLAHAAGTSAAAWTVSKLFRAVHRAGKRGIAEYTLSTIVTPKDRFLEYLLRPQDRVIEYRLIQPLSCH